MTGPVQIPTTPTPAPAPDLTAAVAAIKQVRASLEALSTQLGQVLTGKVLPEATAGFTRIALANQVLTLKLSLPLPAGTSVQVQVQPGSTGLPNVQVIPQPAPLPQAAQPLPLQPSVVLPQPQAPQPQAQQPAQPLPSPTPPAPTTNAQPTPTPTPVTPQASVPAPASPATPNPAPTPQATTQQSPPTPAPASAPATSAPVPAQTATQAQTPSAPPLPSSLNAASPAAATTTQSAPAPTQPTPTPTQSPAAPVTMSTSPPPTTPAVAATASRTPIPASSAPQITVQAQPVAQSSTSTPAQPATSVPPAAPPPAAKASAVPPPQPAPTPTPQPALPAQTLSQRVANSFVPPTANTAPPPPGSAAQLVMAVATQAAANQQSAAPLLQNLAARLPSLPTPVAEAAQRLLAGRISLDKGAPSAETIKQAVLRSGVLLEPPGKSGVPPDAKQALTQLRSALLGWLGGDVDAVSPVVRRPPPPTRGALPRAQGPELPPAPDGSAKEAGKALLSQTEGALSRIRLMQLTSQPPDAARPGASPAAMSEWNLELPMMLGHELAMAHLQIGRDGQNKSKPNERGWRLRFALKFSVLGEVGAQVSMIGRQASVNIWAEEEATAVALEEMLPELAPALAAKGLEVGAIRVRRGIPETQDRAAERPSGRLMDAVR